MKNLVRRLQLLRANIPGRSALSQVFWGLGDQGLSVGAGFLANIALARALSKESYGVFALTYSFFSFLLGLYYAAILEPATVYGSGRYRDRFPEYVRLIVRSSTIACVWLTALLLLASFVVWRMAPHLVSGAVWGLALFAGFLLSGFLLRRLFYVQRQPPFAALSSLVFFLATVGGLWLLQTARSITGFTVYVAQAAGWLAAWAILGPKLRFGRSAQRFLDLEPDYWSEHWKYSKWVLATAFVFQFSQQGYYWILGGFLSAAETANLRAMYLLVGPVEQVFIAFTYLIVPALAAHYAAKKMKAFLSLWRRYLLAVVGISLFYALAVRLGGKLLVHLLYAGKYDGLSPYLFALAFVPSILWIGTTMAHALNAAEKPRFQFWAFVSGGAATFLLGIPFVLHYGLWGAVYGMLASAAAYAATLAGSFLLAFKGAIWAEGRGPRAETWPQRTATDEGCFEAVRTGADEFPASR
ncbi:MAG: lipopolysaccharide biosynthesis protein [Acidobacteriota bacterium]